MKFGFHVGDYDAIAKMNMQRGAGSGDFPCLMCANVRNKRSVELAYGVSGVFVSHADTDYTKYVYRNDAMIRAIADELHARSLHQSNAQFETNQKRLGFNHDPGSIHLMRELHGIYSPIRGTMFDWMHVIMIDGVFGITLGLAMAAIRPLNITYALRNGKGLVLIQ